MDGQQIIIPFEKLAALEPKQLLLFELLRPYGFSETVVSDLISSVSRPHSGTSFYSSSHVIVVDRQRLILQPLPERETALNFLHPEDTACTCLDRKIGIYNYAFSCIEQGRDAASVDADKLIYPLIMRPWQEGDRFKPLGMKGYKKLSDFFIAQKVPLTWKAKIPILVNGNGEIIWVAGYRQDDRYKVTASTTRTVVFRLEA
jgi:tRNA(Ile)-lysidine synthase